MKIAIISDIHANIPALSSVLEDIKKNQVDSIICLGDVATLGPSPREAIKMIKDLNCPCIIGNHEEVLFHPENAEDYDIKGELLDRTIHWCLNKLNSEDINFLKTFVPTLSIKLENNKNLFCYHGSPTSSIGTINNETTNNEIDDFFKSYEPISIAIGGHSHIQMVREHKDLLIVNTGSVGCAFRTPPHSPPAPSLLPYAEYALINSDNNDIAVELKKIDFDIQLFVNTLKSSDLPLKDWWLEEYARLGYE